jgi:hypothetical protein
MLLSDVKNKLRNNEIDLGIMNGWSKETDSLFDKLKVIRVPDTIQSHSLGRCYTAYSFDVVIENQTYTVSYRIDSSG